MIDHDLILLLALPSYPAAPRPSGWKMLTLLNLNHIVGPPIRVSMRGLAGTEGYGRSRVDSGSGERLAQWW